MYTVKEISEKLNLSPHTVRYYCDNNLIPTLKRDKNNVRNFDEKSLNWLIGVMALRNCGMSIESIKSYIDLCLKGDSTVPDRLSIILEQKSIIDKKIKQLQTSSQYLDDKVKLYNGIIQGDMDDVSNPDKW